jgi:hypothetical protein
MNKVAFQTKAKYILTPSVMTDIAVGQRTEVNCTRLIWKR